MSHQTDQSSGSAALECFESCNSTVAHCLERGGAHAALEHIAVLLDCADACMSMVASMRRHSPLHPTVAQFCADACRRCADECDRFPDDEVMRSCGAICRRCADECDQMSGAAS